MGWWACMGQRPSISPARRCSSATGASTTARRTAWVGHRHQALQARSGLPGPSVGAHQLGQWACMGNAGHQLGKVLQPGNRCQHDGKAHSLGRPAPSTAGAQRAARPSVGVHQLGQWACMGGAGHRLALLNVLQHGPSVGTHGHGSHQLGAVGLHGPKAGHQPGNQRQQMHDLNRGNKAKRGNKWGNKPKFFANPHREKRIPTSRPLLICAPVLVGWRGA